MNRKSNTPKNQEANVGKTGRRSAGPKTGKKNELKRLTKEEQLELKNIHIGPTLPGFVSEGVLKVLVENFGLGTITTVEEDLKKYIS